MPFSLSQKSFKSLNHSSIMNIIIYYNLIVNITLGSPRIKNIIIIKKHNIYQIIIASSQLETIKEINEFNENSSSTFIKGKKD